MADAQEILALRARQLAHPVDPRDYVPEFVGDVTSAFSNTGVQVNYDAPQTVLSIQVDKRRVDRRLWFDASIITSSTAIGPTAFQIDAVCRGLLDNETQFEFPIQFQLNRTGNVMNRWEQSGCVMGRSSGALFPNYPSNGTQRAIKGAALQVNNAIGGYWPMIPHEFVATINKLELTVYYLNNTVAAMIFTLACFSQYPK